MSEGEILKKEEPLKTELSTDDYRELAREIRELQKEVDYWRNMAHRYEDAIFTLSAIIAEGKHEDN